MKKEQITTIIEITLFFLVSTSFVAFKEIAIAVISAGTITGLLNYRKAGTNTTLTIFVVCLLLCLCIEKLIDDEISGKTTYIFGLISALLTIGYIIIFKKDNNG